MITNLDIYKENKVDIKQEKKLEEMLLKCFTEKKEDLIKNKKIAPKSLNTHINNYIKAIPPEKKDIELSFVNLESLVNNVINYLKTKYKQTISNKDLPLKNDIKSIMAYNIYDHKYKREDDGIFLFVSGDIRRSIIQRNEIKKLLGGTYVAYNASLKNIANRQTKDKQYILKKIGIDYKENKITEKEFVDQINKYIKTDFGSLVKEETIGIVFGTAKYCYNEINQDLKKRRKYALRESRKMKIYLTE